MKGGGAAGQAEEGGEWRGWGTGRWGRMGGRKDGGSGRGLGGGRWGLEGVGQGRQAEEDGEGRGWGSEHGGRGRGRRNPPTTFKPRTHPNPCLAAVCCVARWSRGRTAPARRRAARRVARRRRTSTASPCSTSGEGAGSGGERWTNPVRKQSRCKEKPQPHMRREGDCIHGYRRNGGGWIGAGLGGGSRRRPPMHGAVIGWWAYRWWGGLLGLMMLRRRMATSLSYRLAISRASITCLSCLPVVCVPSAAAAPAPAPDAILPLLTLCSLQCILCRFFSLGWYLQPPPPPGLTRFRSGCARWWCCRARPCGRRS